MHAPAASSAARSPGPVGLVLLLGGMFGMMLIEYLLFPLSNMPGSGLRYLGFPPLILALFFLAGSRFAQHIYGFNDFKSGFQYLMARVFGVNLPSLVVSDGKIHVDVMGQENILYTAGGPGYLLVMPGNVALLEALDGSLRVVGAGQRYVGPFERVKEVLSLEERYDHIEKSSATTRDGIEVTARDIRYRYRLYSGTDGGNFGRSAENPYPYSDEGMIQMVYNRAMGANGISDWHSGVRGTVEGIIQDFIRQNMIDHLTAPEPGSEDPRAEIYRQFHNENGKKRFREKGAELLWIDIGHLGLPEKVVGQRTDLWQARWSGNAEITRAYGEAERSNYAEPKMERGRSAAETEILIQLIKMLEKKGG